MNRKVIKARDVMHANHLEIDGMATVAEALSAMRKERSEVLIVKKRNENDAFGIVLLADIAKEVLARDRAAERVNVYEIMAKPVIAVKPTMNVRYIARLFDNIGISVAPVIDGDDVQGVISYNDIVLDGLI